MAKVNYTREDALVFIDYLSEKAALHSGDKIPAYVRGYLSSMFVEFAEASPKVKKILLDDVNRVKSEKQNDSAFA